MRFRFAALLVPVLLFGCGSPPDGEEAAKQAAAKQSAAKTAEQQPGFFDELPQFIDVTEIDSINATRDRLNARYRLMIDHHRDRIEGATILDFGSYDGRWTYAAIEAGAKHVTGIEINPEYQAQAEKNMEELGVSSDRYNFVVGDVLAELNKVTPGSIDGVIFAGLYYHITYHVELMEALKRSGVKWVIMDTQVLGSEEPIIKWVPGPNGLNGLEGIPSARAVEMIAEYAGFQYEYVPLDQLTSPEMWDYRMGTRITMTIF
jgi:16S rRNA G966 N2-methylase RsmD